MLVSKDSYKYQKETIVVEAYTDKDAPVLICGDAARAAIENYASTHTVKYIASPPGDEVQECEGKDEIMASEYALREVIKAVFGEPESEESWVSPDIVF